jgi:hypothetical protein
MRVYVSCNCRTCRRASSAVKGIHKKQAHRTLRRLTKRALRTGTEAPVAVYTGYKD